MQANFQKTLSAIDSRSRGTAAPLMATIPHGVTDYFWNAAAERRQVTDSLLQLFRTWGYGDVILPAFEYIETLDRSGNDAFRAELYRFMDRDGSTLALRADMTIAVARLVATRLHDVPMPQRFCYADSIFRYAKPQGGRQREFWQAGIELIGSNAPAADAEVLALAARAMRVAGLSETRIAVGHLGYFHALLRALDLTPEGESALISAVDRNSDADLALFLQQTTLPDSQRAAVAIMPHLSGDDPAAIFERARQVALDVAMHAALDNLAAILDALRLNALDNPIVVDLSEINNLGYYSGITFEVLTPGLGFPIASGGRYDHLVGNFGTEQPAVGVALVIERILLARRWQSGNGTPHPIRAHLMLPAYADSQMRALVETWRSAGLRVLFSLDDSEDTLQEAAHRAGITATMDPVEGGATVQLFGQDAQHLDANQLTAWAMTLVDGDKP